MRLLLLLPVEYSPDSPDSPNSPNTSAEVVASAVNDSFGAIRRVLSSQGIDLLDVKPVLQNLTTEDTSALTTDEMMSHIDWIARQFKLTIREASAVNNPSIKTYLLEQSKDLIKRLLNFCK